MASLYLFFLTPFVRFNTPERYLNDNQLRFHGKSSSFKLISHTRELMQRHIVETSSDGRQSNSPADIQLPTPTSNKRPEFWMLPPVRPRWRVCGPSPWLIAIIVGEDV